MQVGCACDAAFLDRRYTYGCADMREGQDSCQIWRMKSCKKGHTRGFTRSFMSFSRQVVLLLLRSRLACKADLWAYDRFLQTSKISLKRR